MTGETIETCSLRKTVIHASVYHARLATPPPKVLHDAGFASIPACALERCHDIQSDLFTAARLTWNCECQSRCTVIGWALTALISWHRTRGRMATLTETLGSKFSYSIYQTFFWFQQENQWKMRRSQSLFYRGTTMPPSLPFSADVHARCFHQHQESWELEVSCELRENVYFL